MEAIKLNRLTSMHVMREMDVPKMDYIEEEVFLQVKKSDLKIKCNGLINTLQDNQTVVFNGSLEYLERKSEEYLQELFYDSDEWHRPLFKYSANTDTEHMRSADTAKESIESALRILKVTEPATIIIIVRHKHEHQNIGFF